MTLERYNHCVQRHLVRGYSCNEEAHEIIGRKRIETAEKNAQKRTTAQDSTEARAKTS